MINYNKKFFLFGVILILILFLFTWQYSKAQPSSSGQVNSPDAIAVRIIPNPNHYSITTWYAKQGFQGSPQSLKVDGYQAIRDGRTVYVNAADVNLQTKTIYTNIYLISYNQNSAPNTVDILGQIISHWKFNDNLSNNTTNLTSANCSISTLNCASNSDCSTDQYCATSGNASGTCLFKIPKNCLSDADCPTNFFCDSLKSKVTRDVKRVASLVGLKTALTNFKTVNNHYPLLAAGTYLTNNSVSLWPSWSQVLLKDLTVAPNILDPINHLGSCPGYDPITCWNQSSKKFFSEPTQSTLVLPPNSYALAYSANSSGSNYNLCATLETRALNYHFSPNNPTGSNCVIATGITAGASTSNTPPYLVNKFLKGEVNQEFNGFIQVKDANSDPLAWSLIPLSTNWSGWYNNGQNNKAPILKDTSNLNQKKVYAELAGKTGTYKMLLKVSDGRGGILSTTTLITILASPLTITAENGKYTLGSDLPFNYSFSFAGPSLSTAPTYSTTPTPNTYSVTKVSGPFDLLNDLTGSITSPGRHRYQVSYSGSLPINKLTQGASFVYKITLTDSSGNSVNKEFSLKIIPGTSNFSININCPSVVRTNNPYNCQLDTSVPINYSVSDLPANLIATDSKIIGSVISAGNFPITIKAKNNLGAQASAKFTLKVNTYCGDGIKQNPNSEGRGGFNNNGNEFCDGNDGITDQPNLSSISKQYGCSTAVGAVSPYPILTNDQCVFKSSVNGGGFCGDGICELSINGKKIENYSNCKEDCAPPPCTPVCSGKCSGADDSCGGTCPTTSSNSVCTSGTTKSCSEVLNKPAGSYTGTAVCNSSCSGFDTSACEPACTPVCSGKCSGADDSCGGTCPSTSSNSVCASGTTKSCSEALGWPAGSYVGTAVCNNSCSGFDTSTCEPSGFYWYRVPSSEDSYLIPGETVCMIKLNVDTNGNIICNNEQANASAQWFRGKIESVDGWKYGPIKYCSVYVSPESSCTGVKNPNKCRYFSGSWSNHCYVHKYW